MLDWNKILLKPLMSGRKGIAMLSRLRLPLNDRRAIKAKYKTKYIEGTWTAKLFSVQLLKVF